MNIAPTAPATPATSTAAPEPGFIVDANGNGKMDEADAAGVRSVGIGQAVAGTIQQIRANPNLRCVAIGSVHGLDMDAYILNLVNTLKTDPQNPTAVALCVEMDGSYIKDEVKDVQDLDTANLQAIVDAGGDPASLSPKAKKAFEALHKANVKMRNDVNQGDGSYDSPYTKIESYKLFFKAAFCKLNDIPLVFFDELPKNSVRQTPDADGHVTPYRDRNMALKVCEDDAKRAEEKEPPLLYIFDTGDVHAANMPIADNPFFKAASIDNGNETFAQKLRKLFGDNGVATYRVVADGNRMNSRDVTREQTIANAYPFTGPDKNPKTVEDNYPFSLYDHVLLLNPLQE
jgi:hypothetical protein